MLTRLYRDDTGFIVSAELVLVATILVIGLIVGLSEVQHAVVAELNDVGDAIGSINQTFSFTGFSKAKKGGGIFTRGSYFNDRVDECDSNQCMIDCDEPVGEGPKHHHGGHRG